MHLTTEDQHRRATTFRDLHAGPDVFVVPNPWDAGTARVLTQLGFPALATTSAGLAFSLGRRDGADEVSRDEVIDNARSIVAATHLPVSGDLESGYGATSEGVAETIELAAGAGLVGGSIEDTTGDPAAPIRPLDEAVGRVTAAVEAARSLPFPFTVTARADNFLHGRPDLDDTLRRLRAFESAGADVLYAPGLPDIDAIRAVCHSVQRPVNVLVGGPGPVLSAETLQACGATRLSLGSALPRVALQSVLRAAREALDGGAFEALQDATPYGEANALMEQRRGFPGEGEEAGQ